MSVVLRIVTVALLSASLSLGPGAAWSQGIRDQEMILSRADTERLFSLSQQQWLAQRAELIRLGLARPHGELPEAAGFRSEVQPGMFLVVVVRFGNGPNRPDVVSVGSVFRADIFSAMSQDVEASRRHLQATVETARRELAPDFFVHGEVMWQPDGAAVLFTIMRAR